MMQPDPKQVSGEALKAPEPKEPRARQVEADVEKSFRDIGSGGGESGSPLIDQGDRVWVWFCTKDGRAVEVSNIDQEEFDWPGECRTCRAPLNGPHEYLLSTPPQPESGSAADPAAGLPPELGAALKDRSVTIEADDSVFEKIAEWRDAPSNTVSAAPTPPESGSGEEGETNRSAPEGAIMAEFHSSYAPDWAKGVSDDELLAETQRRLAYYMHGWQESYVSAQRARAVASPSTPRDEEGRDA
jgi:hypothetical protein